MSEYLLGEIDITWTREERSVEYYRDKSHVAVFGLFEEGALINWAILWGNKSYSGRFPRKK